MRDWEKLARACRRYLDAFNDEIADDTVLGSVGNDLRIIAIREVLPSGDQRPYAVRLVPRVLGPDHTYALSVARSAVLKAAGKFVTAADMYRKRDLLRSVQEMVDSERACVRVASFLADEIASARASEERAIPEPTEGTTDA